MAETDRERDGFVELSRGVSDEEEAGSPDGRTSQFE